MARILILSYLPLYPTNGGGRVRIHQLATHLARKHSVHIMCPPGQQPPERANLRIYDRGIRGARQLIDPRLITRMNEVVAQVRPDVILLEYLWQAGHALALNLRYRLPLILDAFDVLTVRMRREGRRLAPIASLYERLVLPRVNRVFAVSETDRAQLIALGARASATSIVPNGVDTSRFRPDQASRQRTRAALGCVAGERVMLFFGQLDYAPNREAFEVMAREILPQLSPEYKLLIAGRGSERLPRHLDQRIQVLGSVERIEDYIRAADVITAPIMSGSGTRLKVLESIACGTPTVTTSLGAEGIERHVCGNALVIADGWREFAQAVQQASSTATIEPPRSFIEAYDWSAIAERIEI